MVLSIIFIFLLICNIFDEYLNPQESWFSNLYPFDL